MDMCSLMRYTYIESMDTEDSTVIVSSVACSTRF